MKKYAVVIATVCALACTAGPREEGAESPTRRASPPAEAVVQPSDTPEAPPEKQEPEAPPPTLRVVLEAAGTLSRVGDRPFFGPFDGGFRVLPALAFGKDSRVEERIPPSDRDGTFSIGGHWPAPLFAQGAWGDRGEPDEPFVMVRFDEKWKPARYVRGRYGSDQFVFPWRDQSLLAVSNPDWDAFWTPRIGVIAGAPKSPKLERFQAESGCRASKVASMAVDLGGPLAASLHCKNGSRWLVYWKGDGSPGEIRQLADLDPANLAPGNNGREVQPALGPDGAALFAYAAGDTVVIEERRGGQWHPSSIPRSGAPVKVAVTKHETWVMTTDAIHRETKDGWITVNPPGEGPFRLFAGLETGSPWIVREGGQLWWRDGRGAWVEVELPSSPFEGAGYEAITELIAFGPRDLWIEARHARPTGRLWDRYRHAILTTRPAPAPKLAVCNHPRRGRRCDYLAWPTVDRTCSKQLALVIDRETGGASGNYRRLRKSLKASPLSGPLPTFIEAEIRHVKVLAAWVESYEQGLALLERAPWESPAYPLPVCGDEDSLAASDIVLGEAVNVMEP